MIFCLACLLCLPAFTDTPQPEIPSAETAEPADIFQSTEEKRQLRWYFFAGAVNAYPRMESERLIRKLYDPIMRAIAPGHEAVNTVGDLRDAHILFVPQMGFGVALGKRWAISMHGGYAAGTVRTEQTNRSILLIPWHEDFSIKRGAGFIGGAVDFYPFGHAELREYEGFKDRFKGIRPFGGASVTVTNATYDAKVQIGFKGLPNLGIKISDEWVLPSLNLHYGVDIPINEYSQISTNIGYDHFWEQEQDFESWAFSMTYKYFFR